jgi:hypothetical protein
MVADLTDVNLDAAAIGDLVNDLVVAMANRPTIRAHTFRFARPALTRNLLSGKGDLVARPTVVRQSHQSGSQVAIRISELTASLSHSGPAGPLAGVRIAARDTADDEVPAAPVTLGEAIAGGQVRMIAGNRLIDEDLSGGAVRVIGPEELTGAVRPGGRGVDRLAFSARYAAGRYTEPGDVVFCTSPRPAALVDVEGGSVVVAPARVLRIDATSRHMLLPEVLASDINAVPVMARAWRSWLVRRVPSNERVALADALTAIERHRTHALDRLALLDELKQLVMRGVANGSLTLTTETGCVKGN